MALNLEDDIGILSKNGLVDDLGILDNKPKMTGNPTIDMQEANKQQAIAEQGVKDVNRPLGSLDRATGWPYTNTNIIKDNIGKILGGYGNLGNVATSGVSNIAKNPQEILSTISNKISNPVETLSEASNAITHGSINFVKEYLNRYSKENIKDTLTKDPLGVMMDASMLGGVGKAGISIASPKVKEFMDTITKPNPEQLVAKAENITQRILNPSKDEIADAILNKSKIPAVREVAKVIKKSPDHKALLNNVDEAIKTTFSERDAILKSNNYRMTDNHIKRLEDFINQRKKSGQINEAELSQMENVLAEEKAWYVKNKDSFNRVSGQDRKEYLQDITKTLIEKRADGTKAITQPARKQALDVLRAELRKEVEGNDLRVRDLNSTYDGFKDAREMIANQAAIIEQNTNKGILERAALLAQSVTNPQALATHIALKNSRDISRLSGKAERIMARATQNKVKEVIDNAVKNESVLGLPDLTPKYIKDRINADIGSLGVKGKPRVFGIPEKDPIIQ